MARSQSVTPDYAEVRAALRCANPRCVCHDARGNVHCPSHQDDTPSLTVHEHDGKVLIHCQSGCDQRAVIQALQERDLWPSGSKSNGSHSRRATHVGPPIATFDYRDAHGQLLYEVVRFPNFPDGRKDFCQRKPAKTGGWVYKIGEVDRVPYRLPELVQAVRQCRTILIAEGEKDVESLRALGCHATCNAGGAGKWDASWAVYFGGARVVILPDNDDPGHKHAEDVARSLRDTAASVKVLALPGLLPKGDVTDWLQEGHTLQDLVALAKATPEWKAPAEEPAAPHYNATEFGDAERLTVAHGDNLRFCAETGEWLIWDGMRWAVDHKAHQIIAKAKETVRAIYQEALGIQDEKRRAELMKHAMQSEKAAHARNMEFLARSERGMATARSAFDQDPMLLNCQNGTVNLQNGCLYEHKRTDYITLMAGCEYDVYAEAPTWQRFLERIMPDGEVLGFLQRACGYALTGDTSEQCFFFLHGTGANGKSTMINALLAVLGDYGLQATSDLLLAKKGDRVPADIAELNKRRFVATIEIDDGRRMAEGLVKQMTGGEDLRARFLYQGFFQFTPTHKVFMAANHKPVIRGTDLAIWRRVMLVPFNETIQDAEKDLHLGQKLRAEAPGILRWCVNGCLDWRTHGLQAPEAVRAAVENYRAEQDVLGQFLETCTVRSGISVNATRLYQAYQAWCTTNGEQALTNTAFGRELTARGHVPMRKGGQVLRLGIDVRGEGLEV